MRHISPRRVNRMHFVRSLVLFAVLLLPVFFVGQAATVEAISPVVLSPILSSIPLGTKVTVLEDPRGAFSFEEVTWRGGEFRQAPAASDLGVNFGYSRSVWWLKLDLQRTPDTSVDWLLEVAFPQLDRIDFFGADGQRFTTGDTFPASSRPVLHRHFVFPVFAPKAITENPLGLVPELAATNTATVYLRIASQGILVVPLTLWQSAAFEHDTQVTYVWMAFLHSTILMLGLFNLLLFKDFGDRVYLNFALFAFSIVFVQFVLNGFAAELLWPQFPVWGNIAPLIGASICGCLGALFVRQFLDAPRATPLFDAAILAFSALFALGLITPFFFSAPLVSIQLSFVAIGTLLVSLLAAVRIARRGSASGRWFLLACLPLAIAVVGMVLRNLNILPVNFFTLHGVRVAIVLLAFILSYALAKRISDTLKERNQLQSEAIQTRQKLVDTLQRSEQELEVRVTERTDALEQANARLRENERQLKDAAHSDPLTGLANRLLLDVHMQHAIQIARRDKSVFAVLLIDLDKFKPVNDTYGHAIGDDVLRAVAQRLRKTVREMDTVARLGGDEFVIVLRSVASRQDVGAVAEKITQAIAQPIRVLGVPVEIGASVGIAMFEPGLATLGDLLRRADTAMYEAKRSGGGQHCFFATKPPVQPAPDPQANQADRAA